MSAPVLDDRAFRASLGRFASGVTVVSTVVDGVDPAVTASAFISVSLDPPLVCVNIGRRNRFLTSVVGSRTWAEYDGGDHVMLVGEVIAAHMPSGPDDGPGPELPLLHFRSHYAALLRSAANEHSDVTLRAAIIDDGAGADIAAQATDRSGWQ